MIKAVIFDLDGVIVSTDEYHYLAWKSIADDENIFFDRTVNDRLRGVSRMASLEIILEKASKAYSEEEKQALCTKKNDVYKNLILQLTKDDILPGVSDVLSTLKSNGIKIAIGSSSKNTPIILKQIGLGDYFDAISDGNNITHSKPNPEVFLKAADMLQMPYDQCLVFEDAFSGVEAAKNAGMLAFGVGTACESPLADLKAKDMAQDNVKKELKALCGF